MMNAQALGKLALASLFAAAMVGLVLAITARATNGCKAGLTTIKGFQARVFCGPATVRGTVNGKRFAIANGVCERYPNYFVVNIGTVVLGLGKNKPKLPYFGLLMGKSPAYSYDPAVAKDGTYTKGLITITSPKLKADLHNETDLKITLKNGRRAGRFSGTKPGSTIFNTPTVKVAGSFRC